MKIFQRGVGFAFIFVVFVCVSFAALIVCFEPGSHYVTPG
jgi:hypothetical protein